MRIWFNKTFSSIHSVMRHLKTSDEVQSNTLIFSHTNLDSAASYLADERYEESAELSDEDYLSWAIRFAQMKHINLFWPGKAAALIAENRHRFEEFEVKVLSVAESDVLNLLENKATLYKTLPPEIAVVPDSIPVTTFDEFNSAYTTITHHLKHKKSCIKPAIGVFGLGFRVIDESRTSVRHILNGVENHIPVNELRAAMAHEKNFGTLLVMEYLDGHEWSVDCVANYGQLIAAVQRKKPLLPGKPQVIDNNKTILGMVERLTLHFKLNGIFNAQFKDSPTGPKLLEINARPSGGIGMAILASGINLPELAIRSFLNETVDIPDWNEMPVGKRVAEFNSPMLYF